MTLILLQKDILSLANSNNHYHKLDTFTLPVILLPCHWMIPLGDNHCTSVIHMDNMFVVPSSKLNWSYSKNLLLFSVHIQMQQLEIFLQRPCWNHLQENMTTLGEPHHQNCHVQVRSWLCSPSRQEIKFPWCQSIWSTHPCNNLSFLYIAWNFLLLYRKFSLNFKLTERSSVSQDFEHSHHEKLCAIT